MKSILSVVVTLAVALAVQAQIIPSVEKCFQSMPDLFLPSSETMRLDLIDYYKSGLRSHVKGPFDNTMEIKDMSDSYLRVKTSSVGDIQIKILPIDSASTDSSAFVLAVVRTVQGPAAASDMSFYTLDWQPVKGNYSAPKVSSDVFWDLSMLDSLSQRSLADNFDELGSVEINPENVLSAALYSYDFNSQDNTLTVKSSAEKQLDKAVFKAVTPAFRPTQFYEWQVHGEPSFVLKF